MHTISFGASFYWGVIPTFRWDFGSSENLLDSQSNPYRLIFTSLSFILDGIMGVPPLSLSDCLLYSSKSVKDRIVQQQETSSVLWFSLTTITNSKYKTRFWISSSLLILVLRQILLVDSEESLFSLNSHLSSSLPVQATGTRIEFPTRSYLL